MSIKIEKSENKYLILTEKGKKIGTFELSEDGYYYFYTDGGFWQSWALKDIANKLDEVNKPFDDSVTAYMKRDFEEKAKVEYRKLLNESGMFHEFYPHLTGNWKEDKIEWFEIYTNLEVLRRKYKYKNG